MPEIETLDAIGLRHGTDKSSKGHGYLDFYARFLEPWRQSPVRVMEIGVFNGASVRMWRDYFPKGQIIGVDIDPRTQAYAGERIEIHWGDQGDPAALAQLALRLGPLDVIIDDGSHIWPHQIQTLQALLPCLRPGGLYILEDLHTSYARWKEKFRGGGDETAGAYCCRLAERILSADAAPEPVTEDALMRDAPKLVDSVSFARRTCIFRRRS